MKKTLQVKPLKRYRVPRYPSYSGKDPMNPISGTLSKMGYYSAALLSAVGLFSFTTDGDKKEAKNPVRFSELGFPHTYAMYGTGLPDRLEREVATEIIEKVFKQNGIQLTRDFSIDVGNMAFQASGYNPEKGIGFVWLDNESADVSCFNSWWGVSEKDMLEEDRKALEKFEEDEPDWRETKEFVSKLTKGKSYYRLLAVQRNSWRDEGLQEEIEQYIQSNPPTASADYGKEILKRYDDKMLDLDEIKQVAQDNDYSIAAFSEYADYSAYSAWSKHYANDRKEVIKKLEEMVQDYIDWAQAEGRL